MRPHWDLKAAAWDRHLPRSELFGELLEAVLEAASVGPEDVAVDLGAGSGFLTIPIAQRAGRVFAVDHSQEMLRLLAVRVDDTELPITVTRSDLQRFHPRESVDVVVSNYALHHLSHSSKQRLLGSCHSWMRPGGRLVIADMMVPLTLRPGENAALLGKIRSIARKGLPGYWRIAKNAARWGVGRGEYPAGLDFWMRAMTEAGFRGVGGRRIGAESGVTWGIKPELAE